MIRCINCGHENPDGAKVCAQCGFTLDWVPPTPPDPPKPVVPAEVVLELAPAHLRVAPGGRATARLAGGAPESVGDASWAVVGEAEHFAEASGTGGAVEVIVHPGAEEAPRTLELRIVATRGAGPACARGTLEIAPAEPERQRRGERIPQRRTGRTTAAVVAAVVVLALAGWTGFVLTTRHPATILARSGVCFHTAPNLDPSTRIRLSDGRCEGADHGDTVGVRCDDHGVFRLAALLPWHKRWMTEQSDLVSVKSSISGC